MPVLYLTMDVESWALDPDFDPEERTDRLEFHSGALTVYVRLTPADVYDFLDELAVGWGQVDEDSPGWTPTPALQGPLQVGIDLWCDEVQVVPAEFNGDDAYWQVLISDVEGSQAQLRLRPHDAEALLFVLQRRVREIGPAHGDD